MARKSDRRTWTEWFREGKKSMARRRLAMEVLEDRSVPATITTLLDGPDPSQPIPGSIRAAIIEASRSDGLVTFDPALFAAGPQTLVLNGAVGALVINSGQNLTITGPGANWLTIQSDYGFTAADASSKGADFRQGDQLRQVRDTAGTNGYQGGAIFTVTSINDGADGITGNGIGSITGVAVSNPGSNSALLGMQVPLSQSSPGQFQLEPINGATGTGANITVLNTSYGLNPGIITQQMPVTGNNTLTLSGITFGDTNGNAITQNLGALVVNNCVFGAFNGTITNPELDPTNLRFNKFLLPANNPGGYNIQRETTNFIYADVGAENLSVNVPTFINAGQRAIDFSPGGRDLTVAGSSGESTNTVNETTSTTVFNPLANTLVTAPERLTGTILVGGVVVQTYTVNAAGTLTFTDSGTQSTAVRADSGAIDPSTRQLTLNWNAAPNQDVAATITTVSFFGNDVAAIRATTQNISVSSASFTANGDGAAGEGAMLLAGTGSVALSGVTITGNAVNPASAATQGGVLITGGAVSISATRVSGNTPNAASTQGALRVSTSGAVTVSNSVFDANNPAASSQFRTVEILGNPSSVAISESVFTNNTMGGALALRANAATVTNSHFAGNTSSMTLPAAYGATNGAVAGGAAIVSTGTGALGITGSVFENNSLASVTSANSGGGAVFSDLGGLTITGSVFENNSVAITGYPASAPLPDPTIYSTNPERQPAPRYSGGGAIRSGFSTSITNSLFANNSLTSTVDFWLPPNGISAANPAIPAYGGGGALYISRDTDTSSTNLIVNTTFFMNSASQIGQGIGNANVQATGKGLTGGAIILADGRVPSSPNYTATDTLRGGSSSTTITNATITGNSLVNPFATKNNSNYLSGVGGFTNSDTGGVFNDTRAGSSITVTNLINVQNTGIIYNAPTHPTNPGDPNFGLANTGSRATNGGLGAFGTSGYSMFNPATSPGFAFAGTPGNLTASDQNAGIDSKGLQDNLGPTVGVSASTSIPGVADNTPHQSVLRSVAIDRLSPARDSGRDTTVAPYNIAADVRGALRLINVAVDMGAVELQTTTKTSVTSTLPASIEYGQVQTVDVRVDFDDSKPSATDITGEVRLVTIIPDAQGNNVITVYGSATLVPTAAASPPDSTATITLNPDALSLLPPGANTLYAQYLGDNTYVASQSASFTLTISPATTTTDLASSTPNPADINTHATISVAGTVVVAHPGAAAVSAGLLPAGTVTIGIRQMGSTGAFNPIGTTPLLADGSFTYTFATPALGIYDLQALYNPTDSTRFASSSDTIRQEVGITPTILVSVSATTVERGGLLTLTAAVTPEDTDLVQPGSVTLIKDGVDFITVLRADATSAGADPSKRGVYSVTINTGDPQYNFAVSATPYVITARYNRNDAGDYNTTTSTSSQSVTITTQSTSTNLTSIPGGPTITYGDSLILDAKVNPGILGSIIPFAAGTITFNDFDGTTINLIDSVQNTIALAQPAASVATQSLSVGAHALTATYSGGGDYAGSTSNTINITVEKATTTTSITSTPNPAIVNLGGSILFNVAVASPAVGRAPSNPTGTIVFSSASDPAIATVSIDQATGLATYSFTPLATGRQTITATYSGDGNYTGSAATIEVTVPEISLAPISSAAVQRGALVTLTATMDPADNDVNQPGSIDFFYGSTIITTVARGASTVVNGKQVYSATINTGDNAFSLFVTANPYSIQARYNQDGGNYPTQTSSIQPLQIIAQDTAVTLASPLFPTLGAGQLPYGNRFDLAATLAPSISGSIIPFASNLTGIRILDGTTVIASLPISNDSRSPVFSKADFTVGVHSLTAEFVGDANYAVSTSLPFVLTVTQADTTLDLTSPVDYLPLGQTFSLTASLLSSAQTMPTAISGLVAFTATDKNGVSQNLQTAIVNGGKATSTFTPAAAGHYTITATYAGDNNYKSSSDTRVSTASAITIEIIDPLTSQPASSVRRGADLTLTARLTPSDTAAIDTLTGLPVQPGSVSFKLANGTVITAVARSESGPDPITGTQVYSATINTGNNVHSLQVGQAAISATYNSDGGLYPLVSTGFPATLTVLRQETVTTLTPPDDSSIPYGTAVSFTAEVAPTIPASGDDAIPFASGQIQFFDGSRLIQVSAVNDATRTAALAPDLLTVGTHIISARYSGDSTNYSLSKSQGFVLEVTHAPTTTTLALSNPVITAGSSVALTATVGSDAAGNALRPTGIVEFFSDETVNGEVVPTLVGTGALDQATGLATFTFLPTRVGTYNLSASFPGDDNYSPSESASADSKLKVTTSQPFYAVALQGGSKIATYNTSTNALIATYQPNGPRYTGGFTVARGDVNGDGVSDLLWATNKGSFIRIIDGLTSHDRGGFYAFKSNLNSPVSIAVGDINKDGKGDILVAAAGKNAGGLVRAYSGTSYGQLLYQGAPYGMKFGGGISLASADVNGDGWDDIISSPLSGAVSRVVVVSGQSRTVIRNFLAQAPGYKGGVSVAAADLNDDGMAEIITATSAGRGIVSVFDGSAEITSGALAPALGQLSVGSAGFTGGARVAVISDGNADGQPDLLVTMGPRGGTRTARHAFSAASGSFELIDAFFAFSAREPGANNGLRPA